MSGTKIPLNPLVLMLTYALSPTPIHITPSLRSKNTVRISDDWIIVMGSDQILYNLDSGEVVYITPSWKGILEEFKAKNKIYLSLENEVGKFVKRFPTDLWFPKPEGKKPLLPPHGPDGPDKEWASAFST
jgi:hypothetical protein